MMWVLPYIMLLRLLTLHFAGYLRNLHLVDRCPDQWEQPPSSWPYPRRQDLSWRWTAVSPEAPGKVLWMAKSLQRLI